jgi:fatty acid desaturase
VGFVVDKEALEQVFSEYLDFPCQFSFYRLLHTYHHLSSGPIVADGPSGVSLTPPQEAKKIKLKNTLANETLFKAL